MEHTQAEYKSLVVHLLAQHPDHWTQGAWYPAQLPSGKGVEIRKTRAVKTGAPFLHIRLRVKLVIIDEGTNENHDAGLAWDQWRVNLNTFAMVRTV